MGEFILMAKGINGVYYISDGNKSDMERYLNVLKPLTVDQLKLVEYAGDDLDDLKDDVVLFNTKFENESFDEPELVADGINDAANMEDMDWGIEDSEQDSSEELNFDDGDEEDLLG